METLPSASINKTRFLLYLTTVVLLGRTGWKREPLAGHDHFVLICVAHTLRNLFSNMAQKHQVDYERRFRGLLLCRCLRFRKSVRALVILNTSQIPSADVSYCSFRDMEVGSALRYSVFKSHVTNHHLLPHTHTRTRIPLLHICVS